MFVKFTTSARKWYEIKETQWSWVRNVARGGVRESKKFINKIRMHVTKLQNIKKDEYKKTNITSYRIPVWGLALGSYGHFEFPKYC